MFFPTVFFFWDFRKLYQSEFWQETAHLRAVIKERFNEGKGWAGLGETKQAGIPEAPNPTWAELTR